MLHWGEQTRSPLGANQTAEDTKPSGLPVRWRQRGRDGGIWEASATVSVFLAGISTVSYCNLAVFHCPQCTLCSAVISRHVWRLQRGWLQPFSQCSNTWKNLDYPNLVERHLGHFILTNRKGSATLTTELARNPLFSRSVPMKVPVAVRSAAVEHVHGSFAHEIDLLDVLALDLNTNDFPLFFSPHSIFFLL